MKRILIVLAVTIGLFACKPESQIYAEHQELSPQLEWLKKDVREFKVSIDDNSLSYKMSISFRYTSGFEHESLKVKVTETSPKGVETVKGYLLKVKDTNGDYIGDYAYNIWDSNHLVESSKGYSEPGTYTYKIEHNMPDDPVGFSMEIGLIIEKI